MALCFGATLAGASERGVPGSGARVAADEHLAVPAASVEPVVLALRGSELPTERLRAALAKELGRAVMLEAEPGTATSGDSVSGVVTVTYRREARELAITWDSAGHTVSRVIAAADSLDQVIEDSVLLAGNLAREQVASVTGEAPATAAAPRAEAPPAVAPPVLASPPPPVTKPAETPPPQLLGSASLFFPLATNYAAPEATTNFSLNLLYGRVGAVEGLELGVLNIVSRKKEARVEGLQIGAIGNIARAELTGVQLASLINISGERSLGAQVALGTNLSFGRFQGLQASFLLNRSQELGGVQVAAVNLAGDVDGLQVGLVNVARKLSGVSIGLVNVADDVDGVPIAPISVTRSGGVHPAIWSGTSGYANAGLKFATRKTYTLFFAAMHRDFGRDFLGGGAAVGGRIALGGSFYTDVDIGASWLAAPALSRDATSGDRYHEQLVAPRIRMLLAYRVLPHLGAFVGGSATALIRSERDWDRVSVKVGPELVGGVEL